MVDELEAPVFAWGCCPRQSNTQTIRAEVPCQETRNSTDRTTTRVAVTSAAAEVQIETPTTGTETGRLVAVSRVTLGLFNRAHRS